MSKYDRMWEMLEKYKFNIDLELSIGVTCTLCHQLLINAQLGPCGCNYCRQCIEHFLKEGGKTCPGTDSDCASTELSIDKILPDNSANRRVSNLSVKCLSDKCTHREKLFDMTECEHKCESKTVWSPMEAYKTFVRQIRHSVLMEKENVNRQIKEGIRINEQIKMLVSSTLNELQQFRGKSASFDEVFSKIISEEPINKPIFIKSERCLETDSFPSSEKDSMFQELEQNLISCQIERDKLQAELDKLKKGQHEKHLGTVPVNSEYISSNYEEELNRFRDERDTLRHELLDLQSKRDKDDEDKMLLFGQKLMLEEELDLLRNRLKNTVSGSLDHDNPDIKWKDEVIICQNERDKLMADLEILNRQRDEQDKQKILLVSEKRLLEEELSQIKMLLEHKKINEKDDWRKDVEELTRLNNKIDRQDKEKILLISQKRILEEELHQIKKEIKEREGKNKEIFNFGIGREKPSEELIKLCNERDQQDKEKILLICQKIMIEEELKEVRMVLESQERDKEQDLNNQRIERKRFMEELRELNTRRDEQDKKRIQLVSKIRVMEDEMNKDILEAYNKEHDEVLNYKCIVEELLSEISHLRSVKDTHDKETSLSDSESQKIEEEIVQTKTDTERSIEESKETVPADKVKCDKVIEQLNILNDLRDRQDKEKILLISQKKILEEELDQTRRELKMRGGVITLDPVNYDAERDKLLVEVIKLHNERDKQDKEKILLASQKGMLQQELKQLRTELMRRSEAHKKDKILYKNRKTALKKELDSFINPGDTQDKHKIFWMNHMRILGELKQAQQELRGRKRTNSEDPCIYAVGKDQLMEELALLNKERDKQDKEKILLISQKKMLEEELDRLTTHLKNSDSGPVGFERFDVTLKEELISCRKERDNLRADLDDLNRQRDEQDKQKILLVNQRRMLEEELQHLKTNTEGNVNYDNECFSSVDEENVPQRNQCELSHDVELIKKKAGDMSSEFFSQSDTHSTNFDSTQYSPSLDSPFVCSTDEDYLHRERVVSYADHKFKFYDINDMRSGRTWMRDKNFLTTDGKYRIWITANFGGCQDHHDSYFCFGFTIEGNEEDDKNLWPFLCEVDMKILDESRPERRIDNRKYLRFDRTNRQMFHLGELFHFPCRDINQLDLIQKNSITFECNVDRLL